MNIRRFLSLALAAVMLFGLLAACSDKGSDSPAPSASGTDPGQPDERRYDKTRTIEVGIYWTPDQYDSNLTTVRSTDPRPDIAETRIANMRVIEDRYNIRLEFVDLTWDGIKESISTSIMAGSPDMDIYLSDMNFIIPYLMQGYLLPLSAYTQPGSDIHTDQNVLTTINLCGQPENYLFNSAPIADPFNVYMLGFNWDILQEANQPNPQDLYDDGLWTWEAWLDIMRAVTDPAKGRWGMTLTAGDHFLNDFLSSNGAGIALTETEGLTSPATLEVLDFLYKLLFEYNVAYYDTPEVVEYWDGSDWSNGTYAFFPWAVWLTGRFGITKGGYTFQGYSNCEYTIKTVPFPVGPSGNRATNKDGNLNKNFFFIPVNTKDPDIVYDVFFDYSNWFKGDLSLRDEDFDLTADAFGDDQRGFAYMKKMSGNLQVDMWTFLNPRNADNTRFSPGLLFEGGITPSQFAQQWKNLFQDAIDTIYGK